MELQIPVYSIEDIAETGEDIGAIVKEAVGGTEKRKSSD